MSRTVVTVAIAAALAGWSVSGTAWAQEPVRSFDQLNTRLKVGQKILVTDTQGSETKGTIREIDPAFLVVDSDGQLRTYGADVVQAVERPAHGHAKEGAVGGMLLGFVLSVATCPDCEAEGYLIFGAIGAGLYAGLGALVGAGTRSSKQLVYRAAPTESSGVRLWVGPAVTRYAKGLFVRLTF